MPIFQGQGAISSCLGSRKLLSMRGVVPPKINECVHSTIASAKAFGRPVLGRVAFLEITGARHGPSVSGRSEPFAEPVAGPSGRLLRANVSAVGAFVRLQGSLLPPSVPCLGIGSLQATWRCQGLIGRIRAMYLFVCVTPRQCAQLRFCHVIEAFRHLACWSVAVMFLACCPRPSRHRRAWPLQAAARVGGLAATHVYRVSSHSSAQSDAGPFSTLQNGRSWPRAAWRVAVGSCRRRSCYRWPIATAVQRKLICCSSAVATPVEALPWPYCRSCWNCQVVSGPGSFRFLRLFAWPAHPPTGAAFPASTLRGSGCLRHW